MKVSKRLSTGHKLFNRTSATAVGALGNSAILPMKIPRKTKAKLSAAIVGLCMILGLVTLRDFLSDDPASRVYSALKFLFQSALIVFCILRLAGMQRVLGWVLLVAGVIGGPAIAYLLVASKGQAGGYELAACAALALPVGWLLVFDQDLGRYRLTLPD